MIFMLKVLAAQIKEFKKDSIITPACMILEVIMEMIIPLLMASIIDYGVNAGDMTHILKVGSLMIVIAIIGLLAGLGGAKYGARASTGFARNLRKAMFDKIQTYSFKNIDKYSTSSLITRLTTDVTNLQNSYQMILRLAMRAPASMIVAMVMVFSINAKLASIYLVAVLFLTGVLCLIIPQANKHFRQVFEKYDELNSSVQENVSAIRVVKAYVREDYEKDKFSKANQNIYNMFVRAEKLVVLNMPIMQATVYICILLISWLGAKTIVAGDLTTGELMSLLAYCMNILMNLMMISMIFVMLTMSHASAKRVAEVLQEESDLANARAYLENVLPEFEQQGKEELCRQIIAVLLKIYRIFDEPILMLKMSLKSEVTVPSAEVCMELGYFFMKKEDYEEASECFKRAAFICESEIDIASSGTSALMALALSIRKLAKSPKIKALPKAEYEFESMRLKEMAAEYEQMARDWKPGEIILDL